MDESPDLSLRVVALVSCVLATCALPYSFRASGAELELTKGSVDPAYATKPAEDHGELENATEEGFAPVVYEILTSPPSGSETARVELVLSSEVDAVDRLGANRYTYTYVFENKGETTLKVTLVGARLALSPLFELMKDFSFVLTAGDVKIFQFATASEPELAPATAYNATHDQEGSGWKFVSSGAVSLYLPVSLKPDYTPG